VPRAGEVLTHDISLRAAAAWSIFSDSASLLSCTSDYIATIAPSVGKVLVEATGPAGEQDECGRVCIAHDSLLISVACAVVVCGTRQPADVFSLCVLVRLVCLHLAVATSIALIHSPHTAARAHGTSQTAAGSSR
jgi:hypothetical protein